MLWMRQCWEKMRPFWLAVFVLIAWGLVYRDIMALPGPGSLAGLGWWMPACVAAVHLFLASLLTTALARSLVPGRKQ